jgi:hypothetical protein
MKDTPRRFIVLFVLLVAAFICGMGAGFWRGEGANLAIVDSLQKTLGVTFLGGVPIDLSEIRVAPITPLQPNPIQCFNRHERRFDIAQDTTCRYTVEESRSPSRMLALRLEEGNCVEVEISQENALPVTLTLLSAPAAAEANSDSGNSCSKNDAPRLQIFRGKGELRMTCHDSGAAEGCILVVPE